MPDANATALPEAPLARRPLILAACMAASFMAAVEATIMAIVMPSIATRLGGFGLFSWVFSAYMLAQAVSIPVYGRLADTYGRRKIFYLGTGLFLLGSTLCGFSRSMIQLVLFRLIQGAGAGGVQPIANTIVGDIYRPVERARVQGMLSGVFGVSAVFGPSLGAFIVHYGDWPLVFWMNLPVGAAAIVMIALFLPERTQSRPHQIDYQGSLLLTLAVGGLMMLLTQAVTLSSAMLMTTTLVFLLAAILLAVHETRIAEPMLPLELWRNRVIASSNVGSLVTGTLMMGVTAYLPTYLQGAMGCGANASSIVLAVMSVVWVLGSTTAGLCLPRTTYRRIASMGSLALMSGAALLILMKPASGPAWAGIAAMLVGGGMGFCNTTFMISAQTSVGWEQRGAATSSIMFLRFLGQSLGAAMFGAVLSAGMHYQVPRASHALDDLMAPYKRAALGGHELIRLVDAIAVAMRDAYVLTGTLAVLAFLLALTYPKMLGPATQGQR